MTPMQRALVTSVALSAMVADACSAIAPRPTIVSIEPATIVQGERPHIVVRGWHLAAPLDIQVGEARQPLLIEQSTRAEFSPSRLESGDYDVALYQRGRRVGLLARALTVVGAPEIGPGVKRTTSLQMVGVFANVNRSLVPRIDTHLPLTPPDASVWRLLRVGRAARSERRLGAYRVELSGLDVPAVVALRVGPSCSDTSVEAILATRVFVCADRSASRLPRCGVTQCTRDEIRIAGGLVLPVRTAAGPLDFRVAEIRDAATLPQAPARRKVNTRVIAEIDPAVDAAGSDFAVGSRLVDDAGNDLGVVVTKQGRSVAVSLDCRPASDGCRVGGQWIASGASVQVRLANGPSTLRVQRLQPADMPIALARAGRE